MKTKYWHEFLSSFKNTEGKGRNRFKSRFPLCSLRLKQKKKTMSDERVKTTD
jgi:hypothetical protein